MIESIFPLVEIIFFIVLTCVCALISIIGLISLIRNFRDIGSAFPVYVPIIFLYLSFSSLVFRCDLQFSEFTKPYNEKILIRYLNDSVYCTGTNKVSVQVDREFYYLPRRYDRDTSRMRTGYWKFFYENGNISGEQWYGKNGKILKEKYYRSKGLLQSQYSYSTDKAHIYIKSSFDDGVISSEVKKEYIVIDDERTIKKTKTDFYPNGVKESTTIFIDDQKISSIKWDTIGNIVLKLKYRSDNEIIVDSIGGTYSTRIFVDMNDTNDNTGMYHRGYDEKHVMYFFFTIGIVIFIGLCIFIIWYYRNEKEGRKKKKRENEFLIEKQKVIDEFNKIHSNNQLGIKLSPAIQNIIQKEISNLSDLIEDSSQTFNRQFYQEQLYKLKNDPIAFYEARLSRILNQNQNKNHHYEDGLRKDAEELEAVIADLKRIKKS